VILLTVSSGVIKMLLFRRAEPSHKIQAVPTANALALMIKDYLEVLPKPKGKSGWNFPVDLADLVIEQDYLLSVYSSSMIGIVHAFLFDGEFSPRCPLFDN
jgi:hypothetical protein